MKIINFQKIPLKLILVVISCAVFNAPSQSIAKTNSFSKLFAKMRSKAGEDITESQTTKNKKHKKQTFFLALHENFTRTPIALRTTTKEENILLKTSDGLIRKAVLTLVPNAKGNVVLCHPATMDKNYMIPYQEQVFQDYNTLRFDFRRHGEDCQKQYSTIGKHEIREVEAAVNILKNHCRTSHLPIYGFGISLGAVTLIEAEGNKHLFDGIIVQAPFEKLRNQVKRVFPLYRKPLMHNFIFRQPSKIYAKLKYNVKMRKVQPYISIRNIKTPLFLIQAQNDWLIPKESFNCLLENGKHCIKKVWNPETGQHTGILKTHPEKFVKLCNDFLSDIAPNKQQI